MMVKAAFLAPAEAIEYVYGSGRRDRIAALTDLLPEAVAPDKLAESLPRLRDREVLFSTWGMPPLTPAQLDQLPDLRAVFYAAGSVQGFAGPLLERGVTVVSAWRANAVPVAEFTLAQILLACKGYFRILRDQAGDGGAQASGFRGPGVYGETVGLLGVGAVGRALIGLLRPFQLKIIAYDPFLPDAEARELGVEPAGMDEVFARAFVVSNHLADKPETRGMIAGAHLARLRPGAVFINTGRGATVRESELIEVLRGRPDLTALLDVTDPEPPPADSPLWRLPNVLLTPHIAGGINDEVYRLADYCIEEFDRYAHGEPLRHAVTLPMLAALA